MNKSDWPKHARSLVIVAHPDDETIWMGGLIAKLNNWDWTIYSLCRRHDADRAPKFFKVCRHYGAKGVMTDFEDEGRLALKPGVPLIGKTIEETIKRQEFDYIFTHGRNGEYGHKRHQGVHQAVFGLIKKGNLRAKNLLFFNYEKTGRKFFPLITTAAGSDIIVKLTAREYAAKRKVMTDIYGFAPDGIDANYCTNPESFKISQNSKVKNKIQNSKLFYF